MILFCTARAISKQNLAHYPVGKTRLAPVVRVAMSLAISGITLCSCGMQGIIVFASVMGTSTATVVLESLQNLAAGQGERIDLTPFVIAILLTTVVLKFALFVLCKVNGQGASAVRRCNATAWLPTVGLRPWCVLPCQVSTLAEDHFNDTISNIVAMAAALVAYNWPDSCWWADAAGAIVVGFYIIGVWVYTGWEQVKMLAGYAAAARVWRDSSLTLHRVHPAPPTATPLSQLTLRRFWTWQPTGTSKCSWTRSGRITTGKTTWYVPCEPRWSPPPVQPV